MSFLQRVPFDTWVQRVLEVREKNTFRGMNKNPYVILTSAARVRQAKGTKVPKNEKQRLENLYKSVVNSPKEGEVTYNGCIIRNNSNVTELSYAKDKTIVGIDFNGKYIVVDGEQGKFLSTPIIEKVDIDTDGPNAAIKQGKVTIRCFSLKQLEMFSLFFMQPSMPVILEFGDGTILFEKEKYKNVLDKVYDTNGQQATMRSSVNECLIPKSWNDIHTQFFKYFKSPKSGIQAYNDNILKSIGSYDCLVGLITDFNFSYDQDGTYGVDLTIQAGNQISSALRTSTSVDKKISENPSSKDKKIIIDDNAIVDYIVSMLDLDKGALIKTMQKYPLDTTDTKDEYRGWIKKGTFNFVPKNSTSKEKNDSKTQYVSLGFILQVLANYQLYTQKQDSKLSQTFEIHIPTYKPDERKDRQEPIIPMLVSRNIISYDERVIYPHDNVPVVEYNKTKKQVELNTQKPTDGTINGVNFLIKSNTLKNPYDTQYEESWKLNNDNRKEKFSFANGMNIFISFNEVNKLWLQQVYRINFVYEILSLVNKNCYGFNNLVYAPSFVNGQSSIIDYNFAHSLETELIRTSITSSPFSQSAKKNNEIANQLYKFKIGPQHGTLYDFSLEMNLPDTLASKTVFNFGTELQNVQKLKSKNKKPEELTDEEKEELANDTIAEDVRVASRYQRTLLANTTDGWESFDWIMWKSVENAIKEQGSSPPQINPSAEKQEEAKQDEAAIKNNITANCVVFLIDANKRRTLVYKNLAFLQDKVYSKFEKKLKGAPAPIRVTFTIDGFSGLRVGQVFRIDGVPQVYNEVGCFMIEKMSHSIENEGWKTKIEASLVYNTNFV